MIKRIALYLSGLYPGHYRQPNKLGIIMEIRRIDSTNFGDDFIVLLKNSTDQDYFFTLLSTFKKQHSKKDFKKLIKILKIPKKVKKGPKHKKKQVKEIKRNEFQPEGKTILLVEGKTDVEYIVTARKKLNPKKAIPFEVLESGIDGKNGIANTLKNQLQYSGILGKEDYTIIGLFDNDIEGNTQFKGLDKNLYEDHDIHKTTRKHKHYNFYGLLLPVTGSRKARVSNSISKRYLELEHYFSDAILDKWNIKGEAIAQGSKVFDIRGSKATFSKNIHKLDSEEFLEFKVLFDEIEKLI